MALPKHLASYVGRPIGKREDPCWPWVGSMKRDGYGIVGLRVDGKRTSRNAHRAVYELLVGPIPAGLQLDHLCRTPACVNPAHLEPVTNGENVKRGLTARGVFACGHPVTPENTAQTRETRRCRTCLRARDAAQKRKWRAENPDKVREVNQRYYAANREVLIERERERKRRKHD